MKKKLAILLIVTLILTQGLNMLVFAEGPTALGGQKHIADIKLSSDLGNGKKMDDIIQIWRPNPELVPESLDGSMDKEFIENAIYSYYHDTGVLELLAVAYYNDKGVRGNWISISQTEFSKYAGPIDDSEKFNNAEGSNVHGSNDLDLGGDDVNSGMVTETPDTTPKEQASEWAVDAIEALKAMGVVKDEMFNNYGYNISRQDFAYLSVVLCKTLGADNIPGVYSADLKTFIDTKNEDVIKAYKLSIVNGYGNGKFGPLDPVTREQIDIMLIKAMEEAGVELNKSGASSIVFKDHQDISTWALEAVQVAYHNKIMNGVAELTIAPKNNTTREQALVLVFNILNNEEFNKNK